MREGQRLPAALLLHPTVATETMDAVMQQQSCSAD
jgi:hypothetical protein